MPSVFGCIPSGSRYGNVPNELVHRAGPPFLDNHYRGYQYNASSCHSENVKLSLRREEDMYLMENVRQRTKCTRQPNASVAHIHVS